MKSGALCLDGIEPGTAQDPLNAYSMLPPTFQVMSPSFNSVLFHWNWAMSQSKYFFFHFDSNFWEINMWRTSVKPVHWANRLKLCHLEVRVDRYREREGNKLWSHFLQRADHMTKAFINTTSTCLNLKKGSDKNLGKAHGWIVFVLNYSIHFQYCFETKIAMRHPMQ